MALLAAGYLYGTRRERVSRLRARVFCAGIALLAAAAVTPLDALSFHLLSAHLLQNVVLAEWAPALVVFGIPPGLARAHRARRAGADLTRPPVALPLWLLTYFVWHLPWLYDTALRAPLDAAAPRARALLRRRLPALVAGRAGRAARARRRRPRPVRLRRLRAGEPARAAAGARPDDRLRLLRGGRPALGPLRRSPTSRSPA